MSKNNQSIKEDAVPNILPVSTKDQIKHQIFSFNTAVNLYNSYAIGGPACAATIAATSLSDAFFRAHNITDRSYVSLITFWGYVGWNAVRQIKESNSIPKAYKTALCVTSALISIGMMIKGTDIFVEKAKNGNTISSLMLVGKFLEKTGEITMLEEKFNKSYIDGASYAIQNIPKILSNPCVSKSLYIHAIKSADLIITHVLFRYIPSGTMAAVFASKESEPIKYLTSLALRRIIKELISTISDKSLKQLTKSVEAEISKRVADMVFDDKNLQKVADCTEIQNLRSHIHKIYTQVQSDASTKLQSLIMPIIMPVSTTSSASVSILESNPAIFLVDSAVNSIFLEIISFIVNKFSKKDVLNSENLDYTEINQNGASFRISVTPSSYAYGNIQVIATLGGNKFMHDKVVQYLESSKSQNDLNTNNHHANKIKQLCIDIVTDFLYTGLLMSQNLDQQDLFRIQADVSELQKLLRIEQDIFYVNTFTEDPFESAKKILDTFKKEHIGPSREVNTTLTLCVKDYHLYKGESKHKGTKENKEMLFIKEVNFEAGKIYGIIGKIGTGKTTFVTDIAECMKPIFWSEGKILYPKHGDKPTKTIFCSTTDFSPPSTTLFERLTYRIDTKDVEDNKDKLITDALELFRKLKQEKTEEFLLTKCNYAQNNASTGQGKLYTLISAVLYKSFIKEPVLFVIDETLANLDPGTITHVSEVLKDNFRDSIVLSVDHHAKSYMDSLYDSVIDMSAFVVASPIIEEENTLLGASE